MEQFYDILIAGSIGIAILSIFFLYAKAIIDIHKRKFQLHREKAIWLTIVISAPLLGSIFYFVSKKEKESFIRIPV